MKRATLSLFAAGVFAFVGTIALAADPVPQSPASPSSTASPPTLPAASAQTAAPADAALIAEDKTLREQGFKPEMRKGVKYYCHSEAPLGSRFERTTCMTAEQSMDKRRQSKEMTERAQRIQTNPTKG